MTEDFGRTLATARPQPGELLVFALGQSSFALRGSEALVLIDPWLSTALEEEEGFTRVVAPPLRPEQVDRGRRRLHHARASRPPRPAQRSPRSPTQVPDARFVAPGAGRRRWSRRAGVARGGSCRSAPTRRVEVDGRRASPPSPPRTSCIPTPSAATASGSTSTATTARWATWSSSTATGCSTPATRSGGPASSRQLRRLAPDVAHPADQRPRRDARGAGAVGQPERREAAALAARRRRRGRRSRATSTASPGNTGDPDAFVAALRTWRPCRAARTSSRRVRQLPLAG